MFLVISNGRKDLHPRYIELLGATTKDSENISTIGYMGLGIKQGLDAAHVTGLQPVIVSNDERGRYILRVHDDIELVGDESQIRVLYARYIRERFVGEFDIAAHFDDVDPCASVFEKTEQGKALCAVEAHKKSFVPIGDDQSSAFRPMCEFICNGRDVDPDFKVRMVAEPCLSIDKGVVVHLLLTPEVEFVLENLSKYFKFRVMEDIESPKPFFQKNGIGAIYPKSDVSTRLFVSGVLAHCSSADSQSSIFDYDVCLKSLVSSDRKLTSVSVYKDEVAKLFLSLQNPSLIAIILHGVLSGKAKFETSVLVSMAAWSWPRESLQMWMSVLQKDVFQGKKFAIEIHDPYIDGLAEQVYGFTVLRKLPKQVADLFCIFGVPKTQVIFENVKYEEVLLNDFPESCQKKFLRAREIFYRFFPESILYPIRIMASSLGEHEKTLGNCGIGERIYKEICIITKRRDMLTQSIKSLIITMFHEYRHCLTKAHDFHVAFIDNADETIYGMVVRVLALHGEAVEEF